MKHPEPIEAESKFEVGELFFSTTDPHGVIRFGNDVFSRVSGYRLDHLIGKPHNIIRHPDMPRAVFQVLWNYIEAGKQIAAYVKNMAANGAYYWVVAVVSPIEGGYLSIRLKPTSPLLKQVEGVYRQMRQIEMESGSDPEARREGMRRSTEYLLKVLGELGFPDYDTFMQHLLLTEVRSRRTEMTGHSGGACVSAPPTSGLAATHTGLAPMVDACERLGVEQSAIFSRLGKLLDLQSRVREQIRFAHELGVSVKTMSLNAMVQAENLGSRGMTLQAVAQQISIGTREMIQHTQNISQSLHHTHRILQRGAFCISASDLSVEMMSLFLLQARREASGPTEELKSRITELGQTVSANLSAACEVLEKTAVQLAELEQRLADFNAVVRRLSILHITGKIEASRLDQGGTVLNIFDSVFVRVAEGREKLGELAASIEELRCAPPRRSTLKHLLGTLTGATLETVARPGGAGR